MKKKMIHILDVTLREGNYIIDFQLNKIQVGQIVEYLDGANVGYVEVSNIGNSYPSGLTDLDYIEAARQFSKTSKLGALLNPRCPLKPDFLPEIRSKLDFIRVAVNANEISLAARSIEQLKKHNFFTFIQLARISSITPSKAAIAAKRAEKMGADIIYIVDTMGNLTPNRVKDYVKAVRNTTDLPIGFHGHNNLGMALMNSLEAVHAGCDWIDASLLGAGRQAGNTQLEILALLLEKEGYKTNLDIPLLLDTAEILAAPIFKNYKGIEPYDLWSAYWNLDSYPGWMYQKIALLTGMDINTFIKKLSEIKDFSTLSDQEKLLSISKHFRIPMELIMSHINASISYKCS